MALATQDGSKVNRHGFYDESVFEKECERIFKRTWDEEFLVVDDTRDSIAKLWAVRQTPGSVKFAWGENPPQRVRRFVTNLRVSPTDEKGAYLAESNVLLSFVRASEPVIVLPAGRTDLVREVDGGLKLARRMVRIDLTVINTGHLRLIF
jgi:3-phenylpropionate/cinnamic acid dioxygenase small subunit